MRPWLFSLLLLFASLAAPRAALGAPAPPKPPPVFVSPFGELFHPMPQANDAFDQWFARVDANHDGRIDRVEFRADAERYFKHLDADGNGVIDGFEIAAYEKSVAADLDVGGQGFARGGSEDVVSLLSDPEPVSSADLKLNAHITLAEWLAVTDQRFNMLDVKHQGYLRREELRALLPKSARERKP
jgi:Ca2+-binding EF-hand superfamily protein